MAEINNNVINLDDYRRNRQPPQGRRQEKHTPNYRRRRAAALSAVALALMGGGSVASGETPVGIAKGVLERVAEGTQRPYYSTPADNEPYREVKIGTTTKDEVIFNSLSAITTAIGKKTPLGPKHVYAFEQMLQEQNAAAQRARGVPETEINPTLVHPGEVFRIPAEFEGVGNLVEPDPSD